MRCKTCHYSLEGLSENRCPECGREFDPNDPETFDDGRPSDSLTWSQRVVIAVVVLLGVVALLWLYSFMGRVR